MGDEKRNSITGRLVRSLSRLVFGLVLVSITAVILLRFIPPVTSAFMVARYGKGLLGSMEKTPIRYDWVGWEAMSPHMPLAAVAAEDQKFPTHFGFDVDAITSAFKERANGGRLRGASTISQQVAKNLFLWNGKSYLRKGLEAGFTVLIEIAWPKRRILEVYLNIAEFGDGIYGVEAASRKFFGKPAARLTRREAATLAAVLPNPKQLKASAPSAYVRQRARAIERQMKNLGPSYLKSI